MKVKLVLPLLFLGAASHVLMAQSSGTFTSTGNMITPRAGHTATLLLDGTVLIAGGSGFSVGPSIPADLSSAEIYDPSTGTFTATGSMAVPRCWSHTATLLGNGKVLIAGGLSGCNPPSQTVIAELYDPATRTFAATNSMTDADFTATATLLKDGKVLIAGTSDQINTGASAPFHDPPAQLYDPATGMFAVTGGFVLGTWSDFSGDFGANYASGGEFSSTLLSGGKTLFVWAQTAQLYDPDAGTFSVTGRMITYHGPHTASLLANGKVLVTGGSVDIFDDRGSFYTMFLADAELYDPATGTFTATGKMTIPRVNHTATVLPDGAVLMAGGISYPSVGISADLYDPSTGTFTAAGNMIAARSGGHTVTLLSDGSVLIAGGCGRTPCAELYKPRVLRAAPVLFSLSGDGRGQGAIWHAETGQIASPSYPAIAGEVVSMYTTGLVDGGVIPPLVAVGGRLAEILFFGNAPGFPGFNQVNFRVPSGVEPGPGVSVRLTYLGRPSNEVTIGVR